MQTGRQKILHHTGTNKHISQTEPKIDRVSKFVSIICPGTKKMSFSEHLQNSQTEIFHAQIQLSPENMAKTILVVRV
jgi:hypothetical protein